MSLEAFQLNGKNALVTGSHRGLGAANRCGSGKGRRKRGCHGRDPKPGPSCAEILAAGRKTFYFSGDLAGFEGVPRSYRKKQSRSLVPSTFL